MTTSRSRLKPGGDVLWHVPGRVRPVAATTRADSDLVALLVDDGAQSFRDVRATANFSPDIIELCSIMERYGMLDAPIYSPGDGQVRFVDASMP